MPVKDFSPDTSDLDDAIREMNRVLTYDAFAESSRDVLSSVHTREELDRAREAVFAARDRLMERSDEFRARHQARSEQSRMEAAQRRAELGRQVEKDIGKSKQGRYLPGFMDRGGHEIAPVRLPDVLEAELTWVCLECGTENLNYKTIKGRKNQRAFVKRYAEMMAGLGMPLELREAKRIVKRGVPYCIMCSQRKGRDVYMVKRPLREVQTIKQRSHEEKVQRPPKVLTRREKERNIKRMEKPDKRRGKDKNPSKQD